ncbi:hypothetical protein M413DRAFT_387329 [Hebeloma cylindrosporum]|uniref:Uncharacterized protein n=1 Tax=Hebeloma cylindrosporum TaxID=76867 RepID=A0A0C2Y1J8_HEBCY|nr:hypothetical protein M413DRAFT_387329 [Hebeloma cylindrosporum h7]
MRNSGAERLENVLRRLGLEGKALDGMMRNLRTVATRRVEARSIGEDERRLEALVRSNVEKRRQVQEKINKAAGLGWLCEEYIDLISTFGSETVRDLETMLDEERQRVVGYVDTLRECVMKEREAGDEWMNDVRGALGSSRVKVWEELRERMETVHRSQALVSSPRLLDSKDIAVGEVRVNTAMMERKGRKADHGFALAAEIEGLLVDARRIAKVGLD